MVCASELFCINSSTQAIVPLLFPTVEVYTCGWLVHGEQSMYKLHCDIYIRLEVQWHCIEVCPQPESIAVAADYYTSAMMW